MQLLDGGHAFFVQETGRSGGGVNVPAKGLLAGPGMAESPEAAKQHLAWGPTKLC